MFLYCLIVNPSNVLAPIGVSFGALIDFCGGLKSNSLVQAWLVLAVGFGVSLFPPLAAVTDQPGMGEQELQEDAD